MRRLLAAYDLGKDKIYGHIKTTKNRTQFLELCRYLRSLYPPKVLEGARSAPEQAGV